MNNSEVLTLALVGKTRVGISLQLEPGSVRYIQAHGRGYFQRC